VVLVSQPSREEVDGARSVCLTSVALRKGDARRSPRDYRSFRSLPSLENGLQRLAKEVGRDPDPQAATRNGPHLALRYVLFANATQPDAVHQGGGKRRVDY
jgi:hypothetical protein